MTWRRFLVLLRGLGPNSAFVLTLRAKHGNDAQVIEDPIAAERAVFGILG